MKLEAPIRSVLAQQKDKLHRKSGGAADAPAGGNIFSAVFEKFVLAMVVYFVVSILNSLAQARRRMMYLILVHIVSLLVATPKGFVLRIIFLPIYNLKGGIFDNQRRS